MPETSWKIAIIGLGHRTLHRALGSIGQRATFELAAVCDSDTATAQTFRKIRPEVPCFDSVEQLLDHDKGETAAKRLDCAYIAIPHSEYVIVVPQFLRAGIHVLKEKPAGTTLKELQELQGLAAAHNVRLLTAAQSRYSRHWSQLALWLPFIGTLHIVEGIRKLNVADLGQGWRANRSIARGGALNDLGWHLIDTVLGLAGEGYRPTISYSKMFTTRDYQGYDCEDSAHMVIELIPIADSIRRQAISCNLRVSRIAVQEIDEIIFNGSDGILIARGEDIEILTLLASGEKSMRVTGLKQNSFDEMLRFFDRELRLNVPSQEYESLRLQDLLVTSTIEALYNHRTLSEPDLSKQGINLGKQYPWPRVTQDVINDVQSQLHSSLSIYGNTGIIHEFETDFKQMHGRPDWYALLHNSGTNALHALYYAAQFLPGDEIIFPVYTFHATCSPAMHFGITPIFCDITEHGNIDPIAISKALSPRTKAVVVTHMWGIPCDMIRIQEVLRHHPHIMLFEDCSHAHGASLNDQPVGTFGDGAAWSLQGRKIISGGEGGIVLTKHQDFHCRQLLWGHYNKRCKSEIPVDHPLKEYSLTGTGLKHRAHPLAVAVAMNQLRKLPYFSKTKSLFAARLCAGLASVSFLTVPEISSLHDARIVPSWYAFIMRFLANKAPNGLTREVFVQELLGKGLEDIDIPRSTGLLHRESLFMNPAKALPHVYLSEDYIDRNQGRTFECAQAFHSDIIKLPVWAFEEDHKIVDHYIKTIVAVSIKWQNLSKL